MGFFQELKEDLSQAVNELVPDENLEEEALLAEMELEDKEEAAPAAPAATEEPVDEEVLFLAAEKSMGIDHATDIEDMIAANEEMDKTMADYTAALNAVADKVMEETYSEPEAETYPKEEVTTSTYEAPVIEEPVIEEPVAPVEEVVVEEEPDDFISDEVATITRMMTINGDVTSSGSIDIIGSVNGNVNVKGKITVTGAITGDSQASDIYVQGATINGNLVSTGAIKIGANTVIRGSVFATSAVIAGAVKGDIDVHGPVILDSTAIVMGNIKSKSVQINNGAAIEGMCSQCYADVSPSSFFAD